MRCSLLQDVAVRCARIMCEGLTPWVISAWTSAVQYVYVNIHIYVYVYNIYVCICALPCICICIYGRLPCNMYMYIYMYYTYKCICIHIYICMYMCTALYIHVYVYICALPCAVFGKENRACRYKFWKKRSTAIWYSKPRRSWLLRRNGWHVISLATILNTYIIYMLKSQILLNLLCAQKTDTTPFTIWNGEILKSQLLLYFLHEKALDMTLEKERMARNLSRDFVISKVRSYSIYYTKKMENLSCDIVSTKFVISLATFPAISRATLSCAPKSTGNWVGSDSWAFLSTFFVISPATFAISVATLFAISRVTWHWYGVASVSRIDQIIGLFRRI